MKILFTGLAALALCTLALVPMVNAAEKSNDKKAPKEGQAYSGSGTVIKNNIDICMVTGLRWALHPESGEDVKVYPKTDGATKGLDKAAKSKSTVRVSGTWKETAKCHYVETSKVTIVKK